MTVSPPQVLTPEAVEQIIECPCNDKFRKGTCGKLFDDSLRCFLLRRDDPDCNPVHDAFYKCVSEHPEEYKDMLSKLTTPNLQAEQAASEEKTPQAPLESAKTSETSASGSPSVNN